MIDCIAYAGDVAGSLCLAAYEAQQTAPGLLLATRTLGDRFFRRQRDRANAITSDMRGELEHGLGDPALWVRDYQWNAAIHAVSN